MRRKNNISRKKILKLNKNKNKSKKDNYKRKTRTRNIKRTRNNKLRKMRGGSNVPLKPVPFVAPGGPYNINNENNMLSKGYYYSLSPDMHGSRNILSQSGGSLIPRDLVDLGRNILSTAQNVYSGYVGDVLHSNANPNAYYQPALERSAHLDYDSPNMNDIISQADKKAAAVE